MVDFMGKNCKSRNIPWTGSWKTRGWSFQKDLRVDRLWNISMDGKGNLGIHQRTFGKRETEARSYDWQLEKWIPILETTIKKNKTYHETRCYMYTASFSRCLILWNASKSSAIMYDINSYSSGFKPLLRRKNTSCAWLKTASCPYAAFLIVMMSCLFSGHAHFLSR